MQVTVIKELPNRTDHFPVGSSASVVKTSMRKEHEIPMAINASGHYIVLHSEVYNEHFEGIIPDTLATVVSALLAKTSSFEETAAMLNHMIWETGSFSCFTEADIIRHVRKLNRSHINN